MWIAPRALQQQGMLGMNRRNIDYISRYNNRRRYPLVDNKLETKLLAEDYGIATPRLRQVVRTQHEIRQAARQLAAMDSFAIKPARGSGGKGILVITRQEQGRFIKASGQALDPVDIERDLSNILAGLYSLSGLPDVAIIEDVIRMAPQFTGYSYQGVPDVRIILFKGYPVMAMMRLSTEHSDGKANLHKGAVGVGLDIASGRCLKAVQFNRRLYRHPDTGRHLHDLEIPGWRQLLLRAARCFEATGLGYIGADLVVDAERGALLLELNARPGLAIQVANGFGLLPRLRHLEALRRAHLSPEERVDYAISTFDRQ